MCLVTFMIIQTVNTEKKKLAFARPIRFTYSRDKPAGQSIARSVLCIFTRSCEVYLQLRAPACGLRSHKGVAFSHDIESTFHTLCLLGDCLSVWLAVIWLSPPVSGYIYIIFIQPHPTSSIAIAVMNLTIHIRWIERAHGWCRQLSHGGCLWGVMCCVYFTYNLRVLWVRRAHIVMSIIICRITPPCSQFE